MAAIHTAATGYPLGWSEVGFRHHSLRFLLIPRELGQGCRARVTPTPWAGFLWLLQVEEPGVVVPEARARQPQGLHQLPFQLKLQASVDDGALHRLDAVSGQPTLICNVDHVVVHRQKQHILWVENHQPLLDALSLCIHNTDEGYECRLSQALDGGALPASYGHLEQVLLQFLSFPMLVAG